MTKLAATFILIGTLGTAGILFYLGLTVATGENDYVYWAIRGPLWGLGAIAMGLGAGAAWLAIRAGRD
jgi:hypothetical protein